MNILIIGSGGREHVLAWKIRQSPLVKKIYCAPGNGGMATIGECVAISPMDIEALCAFAKDHLVDLTIVGPEAPLVAGIVDRFAKEGLKIFGPTAAAARLEGSKVFAKEFMARHRVPTAGFAAFSDRTAAGDYLDQVSFPVVVKADGLAAGKGVIICADRAEAEKALDQIMREKVFQEAGRRVVIEECLRGEEASILAISDGEHYCLLETSQDHKRIFDEDLGPNTGGMGAYSPAPVVSQETLWEIDARVIRPVIQGMKDEGVPFQGVLYAGLMLTPEGPKVLEFNVRFGDPEAQVVLPRLKGDLLPLMLAACDGNIKRVKPVWDRRACVCVVMSAGGYPGKYATGDDIQGLERFEGCMDQVVFHAGTKREGDRVLTAGGRVLGVTCLGEDIGQAIDGAYAMVEQIHFDHCFFRRDIGAKALKRLRPVPEITRR